MILILIIFCLLLTLSLGTASTPKLSLLQNLRCWLRLPLKQRSNDPEKVYAEPPGLSSTISVSPVDLDESLHRVYPMLRNSLNKFYFFREEFGDSEVRMNDVIRCMEREEHIKSSVVISEGDCADKLYIVESGFLDIIIHGHYVRTIQSSDMFGELALLYDAPRSASVISKTDCVLWTLKRDDFKRLQDQCVFD